MLMKSSYSPRMKAMKTDMLSSTSETLWWTGIAMHLRWVLQTWSTRVSSSYNIWYMKTLSISMVSPKAVYLIPTKTITDSFSSWTGSPAHSQTSSRSGHSMNKRCLHQTHCKLFQYPDSIWRPHALSKPQRLHDRLRSVMIPIINALRYLHYKNIIFCDLKLANIRFYANGTVKLFDFGLSREVKEEAPHKMGNIVHWFSFMDGTRNGTKKYGLPADIYSLDYVLWELTAIKTPFLGVTHKQHVNYILVKNVWPKVDSHCGSPHVQQLIIDGWDQSPWSWPGLNKFLKVLKSETAHKLSHEYKAKKTALLICIGWALSTKNTRMT